MKAIRILYFFVVLLVISTTALSGITVTGQVVGSDAPTIGIPGAIITLSGTSNYTSLTNGVGDFAIFDVSANSTYTYTVTHEGYSQATGSVTFGSTNHNMGTITLNEIVLPPTDVQAVINGPNVDIDWPNVAEGLPQGYKVWRLLPGQEQAEWNWTLLTPTTITPSNYTDTDWSMMSDGLYLWAVKAVYTGNVMSLPAFSNQLEKISEILYPPVNVIAVETLYDATIRWSIDIPVNDNAERDFLGFKVWRTQTGNIYNEPVWSLLTMFTLNDTVWHDNAWPALPSGSYTWIVRALYSNNYQSVAAYSNPLVKPVDNTDPFITPVVAGISNCSPNPFSTQTSISYSVKDHAPVCLEIYNVKGQMVKTLLSETKAAGNYQVNWNGANDDNQKLSGGIYLCKMTSGRYTSARKIVLE